MLIRTPFCVFRRNLPKFLTNSAQRFTRFKKGIHTQISKYLELHKFKEILQKMNIIDDDNLFPL